MSTGRILVVMVVLTLAAGCAGKPVRTDDNGVAAYGHDVVAYYTEGRAIEGSAAYSHRWRGARWHFATPEHRDLFAGNPERYAPAFGGWCAWAMSEGRLVAGDPEYWAIHDDRLYFNCNQAAQDNWDADRDGNIERAAEHWPGIAGG